MIDVVVNDFGDRSNEIVLVHPVKFDNPAVKNLIVEKIILNLKSKNEIEEGGRVVVMKTNCKRQIEDNTTKV
jgi:hypothetical protein